MNTFMSTILMAFFLVSPASAQTEHTKQSTGDRQIKDTLSPEIRQVYEKAGAWSFILTRADVFDIPNTQSTEIQVGFVDNLPRRIIATVWTDQGKHSAEYYLRNDSLVHVYETFEYFEEAAPEDAWRNFKGLAAWERRSYFQKGEIGYAEATGIRPSTGDDAMLLQARTRRALARIRGSGR